MRVKAENIFSFAHMFHMLAHCAIKFGFHHRTHCKEANLFNQLYFIMRAELSIWLHHHTNRLYGSERFTTSEGRHSGSFGYFKREWTWISHREKSNCNQTPGRTTNTNGSKMLMPLSWNHIHRNPSTKSSTSTSQEIQ